MVGLSQDLEKLIIYSASKQTWARHTSAWKLYADFCENFKINFSLPITVPLARGFTTWAVTKKDLKSSTVMSYISSLNLAHTLGGFRYENLNLDPCIKLALKGASNMRDILSKPGKCRLPMNIYLLEILSHRIAELEWSKLSKQVFWSACTLCFFSACRMGEIVGITEKNFDPNTTLLWENVKFTNNNEILIYLQYSKTTGFKGKIIDLFAIEKNLCCPVKAMNRLRVLAHKEGSFHPNRPVFSFKSGKLLTKAKINQWLSQLLGDFTDENHIITGHSFRAAIPSTLASFPGESNSEEIKLWGLWTTDSYQVYTRQEREKRRALFYKIVDCLYRL